MINVKLEEFPLERLYFLESKEFLDSEEKIYLKSNNSFKINSYYLGLSKRRINNDKMIYLFNGLRGYYDVRSRFIKNPLIKEIRPPMSKLMYQLNYKTRKYKYPDLIIYSLRLFARPTITLNKEKNADTTNYLFPFRLVYYLNKQSLLKARLFNFGKIKVNYLNNLRKTKLKMGINPRRYNKASFRRLKFLDPNILGYTIPLYKEYFQVLTQKIIVVDKAISRFFFKYFIKPRYKFKRMRGFYKVKLGIQLLFTKRVKKKNKRKLAVIKKVYFPRLTKFSFNNLGKIKLGAARLTKFSFNNLGKIKLGAARFSLILPRRKILKKRFRTSRRRLTSMIVSTRNFFKSRSSIWLLNYHKKKKFCNKAARLFGFSRISPTRSSGKGKINLRIRKRNGFKAILEKQDSKKIKLDQIRY